MPTERLSIRKIRELSKDGAAFLKESRNGGGGGFRTFGAETHKIVQRHIGAIPAAQPS